MLRLYFILAICCLIEGAQIVQTKIGNNPEDTLITGKLLNVTVNKNSPQNPIKSPPQNNFIPDEGTIEEIIELKESDKFGPPNMKSVNYIKCHLDPKLVHEIESYEHAVNKIIKLVVYGEFSGRTFETLAELTDTFGARMTGSKQLEDSIDWILEKSKIESLENVHTEPVKAPHWVRNNESLQLLYPRKQTLNILGLGSSVGTPPEGIKAQVLVVKTLEELEENAEKARGNIVVFNPDWTSYVEMVQFRFHGASWAAMFGATATLIRSVTPFSINSPHTGWQHYDEDVNKIPTACITQEDAQMFQRFQDRGETISVHLYMGARNYPDVTSRNSVAELVGYEKPDEVVVVSGHLDSWDTGVGAMDDGGGSMISWVVPVILRRLGLRARRTIRTVLFTGEEQGLYGGKAYFNKHSSDKDKFQLLLESDIGTFNPLGLSFSGNDEAKCIMRKVLSLMHPINTTNLAFPMVGGPDILMWEKAGVPTGSVLNANAQYFWFHHSDGDTMSVEDSAILDRCAALWTAVAYVIGDLNITLPR